MKKSHLSVRPAVVSAGKEHTFTLSSPLKILCPNTEYEVELNGVLLGRECDYPNLHNKTVYNVKSDGKGNIKLNLNLSEEQEYFLWVKKGKLTLGRASVYAVLDDLAGFFPFRGDLHIHTKRSDGCFSPARVCAFYRKNGYDFMAITDHKRYYPSLEAIAAYKNAALELNLVPGEEVHMPDTDLHIVNFGGNYSVNGVWKDSENDREKGVSPNFRSSNGDCPPSITTEEYGREIDAIESTLTVPEGVNKRSYAVLLWICEHVKKAKGLSIFAHPCWVSYVQQVPEIYRDYIMEKRPFDAYEVLGGESYCEQNGFQTVLYYRDREMGRYYPIVGSTDSHFAGKANPNALICSTIVFAKENVKEEIISSIKAMRSLAVDTLSKKFRLVGDIRLVRYACFLMKYYFSLQGKIAKKEGRLMSLYLSLPFIARRLLNKNYGSEKRLRDSFFEF